MRPGRSRSATIFGVYREIVVAERLVYTQGFVTDGFLTPNALVTTTFDEKRRPHDADQHHLAQLEGRPGHASASRASSTARTRSFDQLEAHIRTMA